MVGLDVTTRGRLQLAAAAVAMMMFGMPQRGLLAQAPAAEVHAKGDIAGDWQGTLEAGKSLRVIARIAKTDKGWASKFYSIDQTPQPFTASTTTLEGQTLKFEVALIGASYEGTLSADGNTIVGKWSQGGNPLPLTFVRATKETAWEIPAAPPPIKRMAADADPSFEVATIKPNDSGATSMQQLTINGRNFQTRASSVGDLISFAYDVQKKQIVNAPEWIDKDRYDIAGVPDVEGAPGVVQLKSMIRKLLAERFKLTFHKDKKEMSAFVLTVAKTGPKMTVNESKGPLPGFGMQPTASGLNLPVFNASMNDLSSVLQSMVLDRPVVNQTGLTEKYDFALKFTPDDSMFNGHPPTLPTKADAPKSDAVEPSPSLFEAIQQQAGLKLEAQKTAVEVIAVDHLEKPSAN